MKKKSTKEYWVEKVMGLSFLTAAVALMVVALVFALHSFSVQKNAERVTGTITETYSKGISVSYTYEGEDFETNLSEYSSSMRTGDEIILYVNKENPTKVRTEMLLFLITYILCGVSIPFLIMGIVFLLVLKAKQNKKQNLLQNGRMVEAVVTGGQINYNVQVNNRHPWKLECKYEDPYTGATYLFSSNNIWKDPFLYVGQSVKVYMDRENPRKYYVDVDSLEELETEVQIFDYR